MMNIFGLGAVTGQGVQDRRPAPRDPRASGPVTLRSTGAAAPRVYAGTKLPGPAPVMMTTMAQAKPAVVKTAAPAPRASGGSTTTWLLAGLGALLLLRRKRRRGR